MKIIIPIFIIILIIGIPAFITRLILDHITNNLADKIADKIAKKLNSDYSEPDSSEVTTEQDDIINNIAIYTGISRKQMQKKTRKHEHVRARYIVFAELTKRLGYSLSKAAAVFNYDHSTASWAKKLLNGGDYQMTKYYKEYLETLK